MPRKGIFNDVRIDGNVAYLILTNQKGEAVAETAVDAADLPRLREHGRRWYANECRPGRAYAVHARPRTYLHRFLMDAGDLHVDHADDDPLNNRRSNLRLATRGQNMQNRGAHRDNPTGLKGVRQKSGRWSAAIREGGRQRWLGTFDTPEEAARAYDAAARVLHGKFCRLNFPDAPAAMPPLLTLERPA